MKSSCQGMQAHTKCGIWQFAQQQRRMRQQLRWRSTRSVNAATAQRCLRASMRQFEGGMDDSRNYAALLHAHLQLQARTWSRSIRALPIQRNIDRRPPRWTTVAQNTQIAYTDLGRAVLATYDGRREHRKYTGPGARFGMFVIPLPGASTLPFDSYGRRQQQRLRRGALHTHPHVPSHRATALIARNGNVRLHPLHPLEQQCQATTCGLALKASVPRAKPCLAQHKQLQNSGCPGRALAMSWRTTPLHSHQNKHAACCLHGKRNNNCP